jgi:hypothetical protein
MKMDLKVSTESPYTECVYLLITCHDIMKLSSGVVAHANNPSYLGGRNHEDHSLRAARAKNFMRLHLNQQKVEHMVVHAHHSCYAGSINKRISVQVGLGISKTLSQK